VEVLHRIKNAGKQSLDLAPWALTMMAPGGVGIHGFPPRGKHPEVLYPTNPLVMWAFSNLSDHRWRYTRKYLMLHQDPKTPSRPSWAASIRTPGPPMRWAANCSSSATTPRIRRRTTPISAARSKPLPTPISWKWRRSVRCSI
jgi:hypothetical protein